VSKIEGLVMQSFEAEAEVALGVAPAMPGRSG